MSRLHADIALLFAAAIWGLAFVFQKSAMSHVGPLTFLAARSTVAALALAPAGHARGAPRATEQSGLGFLPVAIGGGVAFFIAGWLQQAGLRHGDRHQHRLPDRALRRHHALHRLGLEQQAAEPVRVAGGRAVGGSAPGCSAAARSARSRRATCWWRSRRCSGRVTWSSPAAPRSFAGRSASRPCSSPIVAALAGSSALLLETVTLAGARRGLARHRLRRAAVERAHLHAADGRPAAHAAFGSSRHRQHGGAVCGARRLPAAERAPRRHRLGRRGDDPERHAAHPAGRHLGGAPRPHLTWPHYSAAARGGSASCSTVGICSRRPAPRRWPSRSKVR